MPWVRKQMRFMLRVTCAFVFAVAPGSTEIIMLGKLIDELHRGTVSQREYAALALAHLAHSNANNRRTIANSDAIGPLVWLAREGTSELEKAHAALALGNLAYNDANNKQAIGLAGGIKPLVDLVREPGQGEPRWGKVGYHWGRLPLLGGTDTQQEYAAFALAYLANNDKNSQAIISAGGVRPLVWLTREGTEEQKQYAALTLANLANNDDFSRQAIESANGIGPLVVLARQGTPKQKEYAADALGNLAYNNPHNKQAIADAGGIDVLVSMAHGGTEMQRQYATFALGDLAHNDENSRRAIASAGGIGTLVWLINEGTETQKEYAALALGNLAENDENARAIASAGGMSPLVSLAREGTSKQQEYAAFALGNLAENDENARAIGSTERSNDAISPVGREQQGLAVDTHGTLTLSDTYDVHTYDVHTSLRTANSGWIPVRNHLRSAVPEGRIPESGIDPLGLLAHAGTERREDNVEARASLNYNDNYYVSHSDQALANVGEIAPLMPLMGEGTEMQTEEWDLSLSVVSLIFPFFCFCVICVRRIEKALKAESATLAEELSSISSPTTQPTLPVTAATRQYSAL